MGPPDKEQRMDTADRLNFDEFDLMCRAADATGAMTCEQLAEGLTGVNLLSRAEISLPKLVAKGFIEAVGDEKFQITERGRQALA